MLAKSLKKNIEFVPSDCYEDKTHSTMSIFITKYMLYVYSFIWTLIFVTCVLYYHINFTDLLNGSKSPVIPSPPPPSASSVFDQASFLAPFASSDKQHRLEFGTVSQKFTSANNSLVNALINNAVQERNRSSRKWLPLL